MPFLLPGLPALPSTFPISTPTLLTSDSVSPGQFQNQWGIFDATTSKPVVTFDTVVSIDYRQGWVIADFPLEQGAFQSYDKVATPFDVRIRFASGETLGNRQALINSVAAIAGTLNKYSVVTPEKTYTSVCVQHQDYRRTATNGVGLLTIEVWLLEVRDQAQAAQISGEPSNTGQTASSTPSAGPDTAFPSASAPPLGPTFDNTNSVSGAAPFNAGSIAGVPLTPSFLFGTLQ